MNSYKCFVCNSGENKELFKKAGFGVVKCSSCGFVYVNPRPSEKELLGYYDEDSFKGKKHQAAEHNKTLKNYTEGEIAYVERAKSDLNEIKRFKEKGRLLDIGCGLGHFLSVAKKDGWETFGIDISEFAVAKCREKGLGEILPGTIESVDFGTTRFDVITAFDVLEHVVDPISFIRRIFDLLNDGGLVVIAVPDVQCFGARISLKNWDQLILPMHLNYFCTKTLKKFLGDNGFNVLRISSQPSITIGLRRILLKLKNPNNFVIINNVIDMFFNVITLFKKHVFYPPINKLATKYQIESNLICVYAKKVRGKE